MLNFQHDDSRIRTRAEIAAGVTPVNYAYVPGDIRRYGLVDLTGATDSSGAINSAIAVNDGDIVFPAGDIRWDTPPTLSAQVNLVLRGAGRGTTPSSTSRTRLFVKNQTTATFVIDNSSPLIQMRVIGMEIDGSNGGDSTADASTTWGGFIQCTKTSGLGFSTLLIEEAYIHSSAIGGIALLNLGNAFVVELRQSMIAYATNGFGISVGGASTISTNITINKSEIHSCRQAYWFTSNVTDATFNDSVIESCCVAGHARHTQVTFNNSYFENIGHDPLSLGRAGITKMSGDITFGNALDSTNCDALFTQLYGTLTLNDCRISNQVATVPGIVHGIGMGSGNGADGACVVNGGTNTETTVPFFRAQIVSERSSFVFVVNDPSPSIVSSIGMLRLYADARLVTDGMAWIAFPASVRRLAKIRRGRFIYGLGLEATYSAALSDQPSGGQNEVNDRVLVTTPAIDGIDEYVCTTAGSPGTWSARSIYAEKTVGVTYSASVTVDANAGDDFEILASNGTAFTINAPTNPVVGRQITLRIYNTSGGALGAVTWNAAFKIAAWTQPANGFNRSITFRRSSVGGGFWYQCGQTGVDVPN